MRSFLARLVSSVTRVVLLAPYLLLLICSACVTSFPFDNLEKGMTMEQATEAFGVPRSMYMGEQHLLQMAIAQTFGRLESAVDLSETRGEQGVKSTWVYPHEEFFWIGPELVVKKEVDLLFEGNKLVSWETRPAPSVPKTGAYSYQNSFPSTMTYPSKDTQHHRKGHKHHHGHGC